MSSAAPADAAPAGTAATAPAPTTPGPTGRAGRDRFLDAVRAVAVIRVVTWHAYGWAPITWVVSAVPAMIYVSGHLLAASLSRRPARVVIGERLRRLLVPFWAFGLGAWAIMAGARLVEGTPETTLRLRDLPLWVLPLNDPHGSVWEAGWLSQPLWYVRVLLWLLLAAPVLWWAARRAPLVAAGALAAATVALEIVQDRTGWRPDWAPDLLWRAGDLTLYAGCFVVGMAQFHGRLVARTTRAWLTVALAGLTVALCWSMWRWPQDGIVNNSHVVHGAMGAAWLALASAARPAIEAWVARPRVGAAVDAIGRRSLTIYLWHSAAIITTWHLLVDHAPLPRGVHSALLAVGTAAVTAVAVACLGWIEDRAARRRRTGPLPRVRPARAVALAAGVAVIALAAAATVPDDARSDLAASGDPSSATAAKPRAPRIPSQGPRPPAFAADASAARSGASSRSSSSGRSAPVPADANTGAGARSLVSGTIDPLAARLAGPSSQPWQPRTTPADAELAAALDGEVDAWVEANGFTGIRIAVGRPGVFAWRHAVGVDGADQLLDADGVFDIESITKTVTATVVWQLVERGLLDPDATVDELPGVPEWPTGTFTVRQLLRHRTTIPDYHDTRDDQIDDRIDPVAAAIASALRAEPLATPTYSSTNYLVLGRVIEAVTGAPLDHVLTAGVLGPSGLGDRFTRAPASSETPGGGAAGLVTDLDGLLAWGDTLLERHAPLTDESWDRMRALDQSTSLGAGLYGYCPCWYDDDGNAVWQRIGHSGGTTSLQYDRVHDVVIALQLPNGVWEGNDAALERLFDALEQSVDAFDARR